MVDLGAARTLLGLAALVRERNGDRGPRPKLLISCRTHYFRTLRDQQNHVTGQERAGPDAHAFRALVLVPLTEDQLAGRPVYGTTLYGGMVLNWLERDSGKHHVHPDHKLRPAAHLAAHLWREGSGALPAERLSPGSSPGSRASRNRGPAMPGCTRTNWRRICARRPFWSARTGPRACELLLGYALRALERGWPVPNLRGLALTEADLSDWEIRTPTGRLALDLSDRDLSGAVLRCELCSLACA